MEKSFVKCTNIYKREVGDRSGKRKRTWKRKRNMNKKEKAAETARETASETEE